MLYLSVCCSKWPTELSACTAELIMLPHRADRFHVSWHLAREFTDSAASIQETLQKIVKSAANWQANVLQRQGSNTGVCLRSNFLLMADIVVEQDRHLLLEDELQLLAEFKVNTLLTLSQHCLLVIVLCPIMPSDASKLTTSLKLMQLAAPVAIASRCRHKSKCNCNFEYKILQNTRTCSHSKSIS